MLYEQGYSSGNDPLPLIVRYGPKSFEDFIGSTDEIEELRGILKRKSIHGFIIIGPIGCGKTTLARIIARELDCTKVFMDFLFATFMVGVTILAVLMGMALCVLPWLLLGVGLMLVGKYLFF